MKLGRVISSVLAAAVVCALALSDSASSPPTSTEAGAPKKIRPPAVAGMFYPGDGAKLRKFVEDSLNAAVKEDFLRPIRAILAPHAGYVYCSQGLGAAYKQIAGTAFTYDTVVLIGPSHHVRTTAAAISSADLWKTPLGDIPVDTALAGKLVDESDRIEFNDVAHAKEHSLEVQLPYLIVASGGRPFKIVPIVTSSSDRLDQEVVARALVKFAGDAGTLIVISTDLSHYPNADTAVQVDRRILDAVRTLNPETVISEDRAIMTKRYPGLAVTMCGIDAVLCVLRAAQGLGITDAKVVSYSHSGMAGGNTENVVGYGAMVFTGSEKKAGERETGPITLSFSAESRRELIAMARDAAKAAVKGEWVSYEESKTPELQVRAGCFVTFKHKGRLRGCIGRFTSDAPLWRTVREMAVASATEDLRFRANPITAEEIPQLEVEISVLSPLRRVRDPLKEIILGRDGIVIRDKGRSGTFLPQVATETGWSLEEFLGHCAREKAGLPWDGWKSPSAEVYAYTATIIGEDK